MGLKMNGSSSNNTQRLSGLRRAAFIGCAVLVTTIALGASDAYAQGTRGLGISSQEASSLDLSWFQKLRLAYHDHKFEQRDAAARTQLRELKSELRELAAEPAANAAELAALSRQILALRGEMVQNRASYQVAVMRVLNDEQETELAELREARRERLAEGARRAAQAHAAQRLANARAELNRRVENVAVNHPAADNARRVVARELRNRGLAIGHVVPRRPDDGLDANVSDEQGTAGVDVRSIGRALQSHAREAAPELIESALSRLQERLDTPENTLQRVDS